MLNGRLVTGFFLFVLVAGIITSLVSVWSVPDSSRYAIDSYSGRDVGNLALYYLLDETGVNVVRHRDTPANLFRGEKRVLLLSPDIFRIEVEKGYLTNMRKWVEQGGQLVIATELENKFKARGVSEETSEKLEEFLGEDALLSSLDLSDLRITDVEPFDENDSDSSVAKDEGALVDSVDDSEEVSFSDLIKTMLADFRLPEEETEVRASGAYSHISGKVGHLFLPTEKRYFDGEGVKRASGSFEIQIRENEWRPIVLKYSLGSGEVVVISEPSIFCNAGIGEMDNSVLAYYLATGDHGRQVVLDEYYHGLLPRGGFSYLLGIPPYAVIALFVFIATGLWAFRAGIRFGPPRPVKVTSRRSILVYVDAMARLFMRAGKYKFALAICRKGLVSDLKREFLLNVGTPEAQVLARLERVDPIRYDLVRNVLMTVDTFLSETKRIHVKMLTQLQEKLQSCRNTN